MAEMARPLPLVSSSSSPTAGPGASVHRALSAHLHRLLSPCQLLASVSSVASRRRALKELIGLIKLDSHSHAALAAADRPSRSHNGRDDWGDESDEKDRQPWEAGFDAAEAEGSGGGFGVSWCVIIRNVIELARADHNSKRPSAEVWEALRYCVDSAERQHHILATVDAPSLLLELVSLVRMLLAHTTDAATLSVCAPAATHLTLLLLSHPPYLAHISAASLTFCFRFYSLTYRAILSSKDEVGCASAVAALTADSSFFNTASIVPPPASLFRFGQPVAHLLAALIQHFPPAQLPDFFLEHAFPFFTAVQSPPHSLPSASVQSVQCFSSSSFAVLLSAFSSSLQRHYAVLHSHVAQSLPTIVNWLLASWPLGTHSGSSLQVKQAASALLTWSFALQLHSPHRTLQCFVPFDSSHPLVAVCVHELRQPLLFTQHGLELHEEGDVITSRIPQPLTMNEGTYRFVRMCVQLFHALELQCGHQRQPQQNNDIDGSVHESKDAVRVECESNDMDRDTKNVTRPHDSSLDSLHGVGGEQRASKRRKAMVNGALRTPLQQCLSALSETSHPPLSLLQFLFLLSSWPASSSVLLCSSTHIGLQLDVLHSLCRLMRRGKSVEIRLWSITCATTLASAHHQHRRQTPTDSMQALLASWADIGSVALSHLLHDEKRIVRQHALSLLASLLYHQLLPQAAQRCVHELLPELPRLLAAGANVAASDGTEATSRGAVKAEVTQYGQDVPDSQSTPSALQFSNPRVECPPCAVKLVAACVLARYRAVMEQSAAPLSVAVESKVDALLVDWLLLVPPSSQGQSLTNNEWHRLAVRLLLHCCDRHADDAMSAFVSCPLSWAEIELPVCALDDARPLSRVRHRSPANLYPPSSQFTVSLDDVGYDSLSEMESFMHTAQFARLLPLPSQVNQPRRAVTVSSRPGIIDPTNAPFVRDQLPRLTLHVHSLLTGSDTVKSSSGSAGDIERCMRQLRSHLHLLRLLAPLVQHSDPLNATLINSELIAPLVGCFASLLLSLPTSVDTLSAVHQLVVDMHDAIGCLLHKAEASSWPHELVHSFIALSSTLMLQLHGLLERADETTASPHSDSASRSSSVAATAARSSSMLPRDDFDGDDDGSRDDFHANSSGAFTAGIIASLLSPALRSLPLYQPCMLAIYHLLLDLLAADIPLQREQRHAIVALTRHSSAPFSFPVLFLASLHDSSVESNNVQLLVATRRVCDAAAAAIEQQRENSAAQTRNQQTPTRRHGSRNRTAKSDEDMDEQEEDEDDDHSAADASDDVATGVKHANLPPVVMEAVAFYLHLCQFVTTGHIVLAHEPESGVDQSEEDVLRAYCGTLLSAAFPPSSSTSANPLSVSPLLRSLCVSFGLASGLLVEWALPLSLFPLLSLAPSASARAVISHSVSRLIDFCIDVKQLWQSGAQQLSDLVSDVRGVQAAAIDKRDAVASAGCDDRLYTLLGCLCSLACHSLHSQRQGVLKLMQLYSSAAEGSKWVARSLLQQMSESLGYTRLSAFPPPCTVASRDAVMCSNGAPSLFVEARSSVVEEHVLYLLTEWMSESTAELSGFPFELLSLNSSTEKPAVLPSSSSAFLHYDSLPLASSLRSFMPHVLRACLLHLPSRQPTLQSLPALVGERHLACLLSLHWPSLFSLLYSLYAHDSPATRESADRLMAFLKRELTDRMFQSLYKSHQIAPIVCQLLSLVALAPSHAALPSYGVDELSKSLIQLAKQKAANPTSTSVSDLLHRAGDDQLLPIILHVRAELYSEYMHERQWLWLRALETVIERLGDSVARGYVCAALLDCLVPLLDESDGRFPAHAGYVAGLTAALMQRVASVAWQKWSRRIRREGHKRSDGYDSTAARPAAALRHPCTGQLRHNRRPTRRSSLVDLLAHRIRSCDSALCPLAFVPRLASSLHSLAALCAACFSRLCSIVVLVLLRGPQRPHQH